MTKELEIREEFVYSAISANRSANNISCNGHLLLYSGCHSIIIYNLKRKIVVCILRGHTDTVNGQTFIPYSPSAGASWQHDQKYYVISTGLDSTAIIWQVESESDMNNSKAGAKLLHRIKSPSSHFTTRTSFITTDNCFISILTPLSGCICVYRDTELIQTIESCSAYFHSKLHFLTYTSPISTAQNLDIQILALGSSDNLVRLYHINNEGKLDELHVLSGFGNWVSSVDFLTLPDRPNESLLAVAAQDRLIRVWQLKLTELDIDETIQVRTNVCKLKGTEINLTCTLETVLSGHEGFVKSLCWFKKSSTAESRLLQLVSCSDDKTIIVWRSSLAQQGSDEAARTKKYEQQPASEGVWQEFKRFGETGEANLPFLSVCLSDDERTIFAHSLRGAIHSWSVIDPAGPENWTPTESICGHFGHVTDLVWDRSGSYLLSSSLDKTCRLHGIATHDNRWHELARPQVHGYEINCLASLNFFEFASGSEEKTVRTFKVTKFFMDNYKALAKGDLPTIHDQDLQSQQLDEIPKHAQLPALGLSNRGSQQPFDITEDDSDRTSAGNQSGNQVDDKPTLSDNNSWQEVGDLVHYLSRIDHLESLPSEEILLQYTLWWEKNKCFGHCNELFALDCDPKGSFLASASKANRGDNADIILWETEKFRKVATIQHHSLTVTRLRFSPDCRYLLSVSRDRTWCLSERNPSGQLRNAYRKLIGTVSSNAIHERIIWDCSWTCDSKYFMTVSRDKKAILWAIDSLTTQAEKSSSISDKNSSNTLLECETVRLFNQSIVAIESAPVQLEVSGEYLFALGFEGGSLELYSVRTGVENGQDRWHLLKSIPDLHQVSIKRLAFQPMVRHCENKQGNDGISSNVSKLLLASGGVDSVVRLTRFHLRA